MSELYETTIQLIRDSGLPLNRIAAGAGVGHRWLADLMTGRYSDPGIKKIQRLHNYLVALRDSKPGEQKVAA